MVVEDEHDSAHHHWTLAHKSVRCIEKCEEKEKILHDDRRPSTNNVEQGSCCSIVHCEVSAWKKSLLQREEGEEKLYCTATASKNESIGERTASA